MSEKIKKFFTYFLSKLKKSRPLIHPASSSSSSSSPIKRMLSGCKQPKTTSFAVARGSDDDAATLSDVDRFLFENFKSLFLGDDEYTTENNDSNSTDDGVSEENKIDPIPGSDRGNPDFPDLLGDCKSSGSGESIVLLAWSANQYEDFRRSMKGMVDARLRTHGMVDWGFMEELLLCYLNLNEKKLHKYVLSAYVDLINGFRESSLERAPAATATAKPRSVRTFRTGREIGKSKVAIRAVEKQD
ncbi:hypothetical protein QN277_010956 [Acacia crassicarpa]|nr:hypothetical protein QN277_010956 [Acacia crassicarpa]